MVRRDSHILIDWFLKQGVPFVNQIDFTNETPCKLWWSYRNEVKTNFLCLFTIMCSWRNCSIPIGEISFWYFGLNWNIAIITNHKTYYKFSNLNSSIITLPLFWYVWCYTVCKFHNFLSLRFYVKSILGILEVQNLAFREVELWF